jgi:hypothetical protein
MRHSAIRELQGALTDSAAVARRDLADSDISAKASPAGQTISIQITAHAMWVNTP